MAVPTFLQSPFLPSIGSAGNTIFIRGSNFTGATAVLFNGTSASFIVKGDTHLNATVPVGATTGPISITNPSGTGVSEDDFNIQAVPGLSNN